MCYFRAIAVVFVFQWLCVIGVPSFGRPGELGVRLADSFIARGIETDRYYDTAVLWRAMEYVYNATGDEKYHDFVVDGIDSILSPNNPNGLFASWNYSEHDLDDIRVGTIFLDLFESEVEHRYKNASEFLKAWLDEQARNSYGGFWHKDPKYPNQMWLDGLYMAEPFYAQYTATFQSTNMSAWDDIFLQFELMEERCHWKSSGLLVHGWTTKPETTEWADPATGKAPHVWIRALGWYFMALVDVLDYYPQDIPRRDRLFSWFQNLAATLLKYQAHNGGWWLVMDPPYPGMPGNYIESSGTAMFAYGMLKGIRKEYLNEKKYLEPARRAYHLLASKFLVNNGTNGTLSWEGTVEVGSLDSNGSYKVCCAVWTLLRQQLTRNKVLHFGSQG